MPRAGKYLAIYLNDHLAGATVGVELVRRAVREHEGTELGAFLRDLAVEIEQDYETLRALMRELGVSEQRLKVASGWVAEKAGRLKLNGHLVHRSPLTAFVELEGLQTGVFAKRQLWVALGSLPLGDDLHGRFAELAERAQRQLEGLEEQRLLAAATVG